MKYHNLAELKELIAARLTVEEIMDVLVWDIYDLVDALEEIIEEEADAFEEAIKD